MKNVWQLFYGEKRSFICKYYIVAIALCSYCRVCAIFHLFRFVNRLIKCALDRIAP